MNEFIRFFQEFGSIFFDGLKSIFMGIFNGIVKMFNVVEYYRVFQAYNDDFTMGSRIMAIVGIIILAAVLILLIVKCIQLISHAIRFRKTLVSEEDLVDEIAKLNKELLKTNYEKDKLFAMKVSQIGLRPNEELLPGMSEEGEEDLQDKVISEGESRFYKLSMVDSKYRDLELPKGNTTISLKEICVQFRDYAASQMGLFYEESIIRFFISSLGASKMIILQGISGTGKTSLPYAFGKFIENDSTIASVQPSWRDRTELFGYFNEFTKRFNETEVLKRIYESSYRDDLNLIVLDEMNIARIEYYFAEMLSILELPSSDEWLVDLVPSTWDSDPSKLLDGKLKIPENIWYVGTANNDDSTFVITDKVYDRAIPIDIDTKGIPFEAPITGHLNISFEHLNSLFKEAKGQFPVSKEILDKLDEMDQYVIDHFRLAFGNRIVKQIKEFVPCYVACGGKEIDAVDLMLAKKILRKFESLNLGLIRDELKGFIRYLDKQFGKTNMKESKAYIARLQKMI